MTDYFDTLETRDPEAREREQFSALRTQLAHAQAVDEAHPHATDERPDAAIVIMVRKVEQIV